MKFSETTGSTGSGQAVLDVCEGISCSLNPITQRPAVTTILMALGDKANSQLVVNGSSAQLIAETVVRYSTPAVSPRILVVLDRANQGESADDAPYTAEELLGRYSTTYIQEPEGGLRASDLAGYDLIWFINPGHPMGLVQSRDALMAFSGGVVIQGDDMTRGLNFDLDALTGLHYIDNGTSVICNGVSYNHNDNNGEQYRVQLNASKFPGESEAAFQFRYGNDIDNSSIVRPDLEILATAKGGPDICTEVRPAIVRYLK